MKKLLLVGFISSTNFIHGQTMNIIIRTKDSLYVAADSRVQDRNANKFDTICKIAKIGHTYFTFAGYLFEGSLNNLFNYIDSSQSIPVIAEEYLRNRYKALQSQLNRLFNNFPDSYKKNFTDYLWSEAIFFGVEADTISCWLTYFELKTSPETPPKLDSGVINLNYVPVVPFLARAGGHTSAIKSLIYSPGIWSRGYKLGIDTLMKIQSKATPENVSFPISIILITPKRHKWLCPCPLK